MQKRAYERIPARIEVMFFCCNSLYTGTVTNLSENGMCINTGMCLPLDSQLEILIPLKDKALNVPVRVVRIAKSESIYDIMGVQLLNPPINYLEFTRSLR